MPSHAAAKRYAKALFELAREEGQVAEILSELRVLNALLEEHVELSDVLLQPLYPATERRAVLQSVLQKLESSALLRNFCTFLIDQRRLADLIAIEEELIRLANRAAGLIVAKVRSATPLSEEQQTRLQRVLEVRSGQQVSLQIEVDAKLIGGLIAQVGDTVFDGSLRTQLHQLRSGLAN